MDNEPSLARRLANAFDDQISRMRGLIRNREDRDIAASLGIQTKPAAQAQKRRSADQLAQEAKSPPPAPHDYVPPDVPKPRPAVGPILPGLGGTRVVRHAPIPQLPQPDHPRPQSEQRIHRPTVTLDRQEDAPKTDGWRPLVRLVGTVETHNPPQSQKPNVVEGLIDRMRPEEQRHARESLQASREAERATRIKDSLQHRSNVVEQLTDRLRQKP